MKKSFFVSVLVAVFAVFAAGCGSKDNDKSSAKEILTVTGSAGSWSVSGDQITGILCKTASLSGITLNFSLSPKAEITPASGIHDFSDGKSVTFTVKAEDGSEKKFTAKASNSQDPC